MLAKATTLGFSVGVTSFILLACKAEQNSTATGMAGGAGTEGEHESSSVTETRAGNTGKPQKIVYTKGNKI